MSIESEALRQIPLFASLHAEDLAQVAALTVERHYERGDLILLEGDAGGALHYVRSGLIKVFKTSAAGKEQVLRLIAAGHTFNDVPALDGGPNPASAAAMEPSVVYIMRRDSLRQLIRTRPEVALAVVQTLAEALRHLVMLVEDLSLRHVSAGCQDPPGTRGVVAGRPAAVSSDTARNGSAGRNRPRGRRASAQRTGDGGSH